MIHIAVRRRMGTWAGLKPKTGWSVRENNEGIYELSAIGDWRLTTDDRPQSVREKRKSPDLQWNG